MSIKSTREITREQAEQMYVDFTLEPLLDGLKESLMAKVSEFSDNKLEDILDEITTDIFSNYLIRDDKFDVLTWEG